MSATPGERVTRIAVVTPQLVVGSGISSLLVGPHGDGTIAMAPVGAGAPDVVFYDVLGLHVGDGADLDALVRCATSTVIAVTRTLRPDLGAAALDRGAQAAISMGATREEFLEVVDAALSGTLGRSSVAREAEEGTRLGHEADLTRREADVLRLIVRGLSNRELADECNLSINSVKSYIRSAYRKMDVISRSQAVAWGVQHGFSLDSEQAPAPAASAPHSRFVRAV
jgi:DNA-binding NarL/FixJ family response regulator